RALRCSSCVLIYFVLCSLHLLPLHSFPTRRSSDLYQFFYALSAGMILLPYLLSAAYFAKIAFTEPESFAGKVGGAMVVWRVFGVDRKSTRLNSSHVSISYAVFCLKKKNK